ncbi:MAG: hypothetical protein BMS9Abin01_1705 [Gammaproteobacteria bacterium]|nr:MAG: hypothetical protein BMS9Abin01_1705 [Gammaproteobacteria bacterium]
MVTYMMGPLSEQVAKMRCDHTKGIQSQCSQKEYR